VLDKTLYHSFWSEPFLHWSPSKFVRKISGVAARHFLTVCTCDFWRHKSKIKKIKKRSERRKHCALAVIRRSQKFSPRLRPPFRGRRTAKIYPAGDSHYLHLQTQFGKDRCTQFWVIVVTDPQLHKQTNRQDRLPYTAPLVSAQCNEKKHSERREHCLLAVVRRSKKNSPRHRPHSPGRGTAKI